jgi:hypothetical protein
VSYKVIAAIGSAPHATTSRIPDSDEPAVSAVCSSDSASARCRLAREGSRHANTATDPTTGTATSHASAPATVNRPANAATVVTTIARACTSRPPAPVEIRAAEPSWTTIEVTAPAPTESPVSRLIASPTVNGERVPRPKSRSVSLRRNQAVAELVTRAAGMPPTTSAAI